MRYSNRPLLVVATMVFCATCLLAQQQTQPQAGVDDNAGFESIFDGKTLAGWDGDPKYWRVEDGALVGEITPGNEIRQNTFIIWRGGSPGNFELKCEYRITEQGNSGINYRSSVDPDQKFVMKGYQFDIDGEKRNAGATFTRHTANNYEEKGRTFMALRGQITRATEGGKRQVIGTLGDYKEMTKYIKGAGEWNQVHIIARGNTLIHMLNGQVMSILVDDDAKGRTMDGQIGVQVHVGGPMKVEYRNIQLKKLESTTSARTGMLKAEFEALVQKLAAVDITPGLALQSKTEQPPFYGIYWEFKKHKAIVAVSFDSANRLSSLEYCDAASFGTSKLQRERATKSVSEITFNDDNSLSIIEVRDRR